MPDPHSALRSGALAGCAALLATAKHPRPNQSVARNARNFIEHLLICVLPFRAGPIIGLHLYRRRIAAEFAPQAEFFFSSFRDRTWQAGPYGSSFANLKRTLRVAAEVPHAIARSHGCPPGAMVRMSPNEAILMHHFLCISDVQLSTMFTGGGLLRSGFTLIRNRWPSGETS